MACEKIKASDQLHDCIYGTCSIYVVFYAFCKFSCLIYGLDRLESL
jgi:hypothetical protein